MAFGDAGPAGPACRRGERADRTEAAAGALDGAPIHVADHCYGCTAGQGSSCGGALGSETAAAPSCGA
ncbi:MAG TPA: DUF3641 domain-containing protein [Rubrivivax sp.]|nr:DUF3641 domain-containing protein [Rubrivivax sp.]